MAKIDTQKIWDCFNDLQNSIPIIIDSAGQEDLEMIREITLDLLNAINEAIVDRVINEIRNAGKTGKENK